jgi:hypothetical protein
MKDKTLAVYRHAMVLHDISEQTSSLFTLPDKCVPLSAIATNDFETYYLIRGHRGSHLEIFCAKSTPSDIAPPAEPIARLVAAGHELLHAMLLRIGGSLQLLLIWDDQHSLIVELEHHRNLIP